MIHHPIASADFSKKTLKGLTQKGIRIIGIQMIPGDGPMPMANATKAYCIDNNGTGQVISFRHLTTL